MDGRPRLERLRWHDRLRTVLAGGEWSLPVDRSFIDANPAALSAPHHDYPAWDFGVPVGTTIFAIHAGTVDRVSNWSGNCYGHRDSCVEMCGTGLTIQDTDGIRWIYCHASRLTVSLGEQVVAGQPIMLSGNSGHSSGPHLHLGIRIDGVGYCPQSLLRDLYLNAAPTAPSLLPTTACVNSSGSASSIACSRVMVELYGSHIG